MSLRSRPDPALVERAEAEAMYRLGSRAPAAAREALGLECVRLAGGVVLAMRDDPVNYWSRALGFGFDGPVTAELVGEICDFYRSRSVPSAVLQVAPAALPADWAEICAKYRLERTSSWVKFARDLTDVPERDAGPAVERIGAPGRTAREWASALMRGFGMPAEPLIQMTAALTGHPRFHAYLIRSGGEAVSAAGMYVHGEIAHLVAAATLPPHRGRGGQSALLRARIRDAASAGCRFSVADTQIERPGTHNSSLHNLGRAGFTRLYVRDDWTWTLANDTAGCPE
ncbi:hypothetical protein SAMN05444920_12835 [Nonomuraea solani]|uniref:N-acetyltransferase domain-containing protein n=1 Tax=Nonomuraea solani TaxID=1144553 RepID=A0A1H6EXJ5_9ACTN|nr:GNAT family N-acetyltransferase [Nonomuraea solani]SEH02608.1 hypothetical protein SAMN05444920_12835 [Nonomuraea solani]